MAARAKCRCYGWDNSGQTSDTIRQAEQVTDLWKRSRAKRLWRTRRLQWLHASLRGALKITNVHSYSSYYAAAKVKVSLCSFRYCAEASWIGLMRTRACSTCSNTHNNRRKHIYGGMKSSSSLMCVILLVKVEVSGLNVSSIQVAPLGMLAYQDSVAFVCHFVTCEIWMLIILDCFPSMKMTMMKKMMVQRLAACHCFE